VHGQDLENDPGQDKDRGCSMEGKGIKERNIMARKILGMNKNRRPWE
jgi:hypothetical protein